MSPLYKDFANTVLQTYKHKGVFRTMPNIYNGSCCNVFRGTLNTPLNHSQTQILSYENKKALSSFYHKNIFDRKLM